MRNAIRLVLAGCVALALSLGTVTTVRSGVRMRVDRSPT